MNPGKTSWPARRRRPYPEATAAFAEAGVRARPAPAKDARRAGEVGAAPDAGAAAGPAQASVVPLPDGRAAMIFTLTHDTLGPLRCTVTAGRQGVVATFASDDPHTRRLLASEAPRLRDQLEGRGLRPCAVVVAQPEP